MTLTTLLAREQVSRTELGDHLDLLSGAERIAQCVVLSPLQQKRLWEVAAAMPHGGGDLVAPGREQGTTVFAGRNSLRVFTRFEKRFARQGQAVVGYNKHALGWLIGPGYFTVQPAASGEALRFDYSQLPAYAPGGWPPVAPNSSFFSRPVYGDLQDDVVWVSADVLVGSALRAGAPLDSYFVLARATQ